MGFAIYRSVKFASSAPVALIGGILRFGICSMIVINDKTFYDFPIMYGGCPFYLGNGKLEGAKKVYPVFAPYSTRKRGIIPIYQAAAKNCLIKPEHTQMGQS